MVSHARRGTFKNTTTIPKVKGQRPFIAWDGEGEHHSHLRGKYLLFGASTGDDIDSPEGLRASECFKLMLDVAEQNPRAIHVAFAFTYDVTMLCMSLPVRTRERIATGKAVWWKQYRIEFLNRKWFKLYDKLRKRSITIYDIFTFFQCSALKAWEEYLPEESDLEVVKQGKSGRSSFTYGDIDFLREYMHRELQLYVKLVDKLRLLLLQLNVKPYGWYGPGAVASAFLKSQGIDKALSRDLPDSVIQAAQYAYFGGRFEQFKTGVYYGRVFKSDIRSAYPHALRTMPNLADGAWHYVGKHEQPGTRRVLQFSLYHVRLRSGGNPDTLHYHTTIYPFPYRDFRGLIHYPAETEGWYWGVEVLAALKHAQPGEIEIIEAWEFIPNSNSRPFHFIEDTYRQRRKWIEEHNPVQLAAKLCMNSVYGKLAQRVGFNEDEMLPPRWHQLEYAGYTTAYCRAMVYDVMASNPESIIAVETDGVFSQQPLALPIDTEALGDWEVEEYAGIAYVQSGVYCLLQYGKWEVRENRTPLFSGGTWKSQKMRGFSKGDFKTQDVLDAANGLNPIVAHTHRFAALRGYWNDQRIGQFLDNNHDMEWGGGGKRRHDRALCELCLVGGTGMHDCYVTSGGGISTKHVLPWRIDNRDMMIRSLNAYLNSKGTVALFTLTDAVT